MARKKLTAKQEAFVREYLIDLNATQAAKRAGYKGNNLNDIGAQLLSKTQLQEAIKAAQQERNKRTELTQDWVIHGLRREAKRTGEGSSHSARVRSYELLGQHLGIFEAGKSGGLESLIEILEGVDIAVIIGQKPGIPYVRLTGREHANGDKQNGALEAPKAAG